MQDLSSVKKIKTRCPGRISLSKHADYINSHLLYVLDDRETIITSSLSSGDSVVTLKNSDFGDRSYPISEIDKALENKLDWSFYILRILKELNLVEAIKDHELCLEIESSIPAAGGLSSSHALILSCIRNLAELFSLKALQECFRDPIACKEKSFELIKLCQNIEKGRGFKSGLGDQCAQIFSRKGYITSIKIFPNLDIKYIKIPSDISFITIPSFIKADKSSPEFIAKNTNIEKYKTLNDLSQKFRVDYLADLHEVLTQEQIFDFLDSIKDRVLRGLALYGLAESKRVKSLSTDFNIEKLGEHLNLSHLAEKNYIFDSEGKAKEITESKKLDYLYDRNLDLEKHSGYYDASTEANDRLQELCKNFPGVYGSSITGAGFGGNNIAIVKSSQAQSLKQKLLDEYYLSAHPDKDLSLLHISQSNDGVSLI